MAIQVAQQTFNVHHTGELKASVSALALAIHHDGPISTVSFAGVYNTIHHPGPLQPVQVAAEYLVTHRSLGIVLVADVAESEAEIAPAGMSWAWNLTRDDEVLVPEINPYRPTVPDEYDDFQRQNQDILREQHNKIQAGDTTFPWELLTKVQPTQLFRLGSIGKFYHETHGIILARYVQFQKMDSTAYINGPVGTWDNQLRVTNPWIVTNRLDQSDADAVVGIMTAYDRPADGEYGWAMVDGSPWFPLGSRRSGGLAQGSPFAWSGSGSVDFDSTGRVIARRSLTVTSPGLAAGTMRVQFEGLGLYDVRTLLDSEVGPINESIEGILAAIAALEGNDGGAAGLQAQIASLRIALGNEIRRAQAAEQAIRSQLSGLLTLSEVEALVAAATEGIQAGIDSALAQAQQALAAANSALSQLVQLSSVPGDIASLQADVGYILSLIQALTDQPRVFLPAVLGDIPPTFVYLPNGELVYVEILP